MTPGNDGWGPNNPVDGVAAPAELVVDVGPRGLRARLTNTSQAGRAALDVAGVRGDRPVAAADLVEAITPLVQGRVPPATTVWSLPPRAVDADELLDLLTRGVGATRTAVLRHDTAALIGALGAVGPGVVIDMGVGVSALATDFDQVWHAVDGWGFALGDRGSAAWLGAQGLSAALRHRDGVPGGSPVLYDAARRELGDERTWPDELQARGEAHVCADFASTVGWFARRDTVAEGLCRLAAEHLADTLCAGAAVVPGAPVAATGGLLLIDAVKVSLAAALARRHVFLVPALGDALSGVGVLARHLSAGGSVPHRPPYVHTLGQPRLTA